LLLFHQANRKSDGPFLNQALIGQTEEAKLALGIDL
jgi:hypothetical protein